MVKVNNIHGKIIELTKNVCLVEPRGKRSSRSQFRAGDGVTPRLFRVTGGYLNWWLTDRANKLTEEIAAMAMEFDPSLREGNLRSLSQAVKEVLKENALNKSLFDTDKVWGDPVGTLFEARAVANATEFAGRLWGKIHAAMASSISKWLVVLPLIKVRAPSEEIGLDGLRLLAPGDEGGWEKLAAEYRIPTEWNPAVGGSGTTNLSNDIKGLPVTWLACEVAAGTEDSARRIAERRMRTFAAVLFSTLYPSRRGLLSKSSARPLNTCVQFPDHKSSGPFTEFHAPFGTIIPPISNPVELSQPDVTAIKDWYRRFQASPDDIKKRCRSGSQFLNYGVVAGGIERFIHFYITLDALFGERYRVERNISRGLRLLFPGEPKWDYRAERLFKLRNSVVHGESVAVEEWDEFESYRSHAGSDPNNDIAAAAMAAFRLFPDNPALAPEPPQAVKGNGGLALCAAAFLSGVYLSSKWWRR